jgi:hypothetical protein
MSEPSVDVNPQESEEMNVQQVATILQSLSQDVVSGTNDELVVDASIKGRVVEIFNTFQEKALEVAGKVSKVNTDFTEIKEKAGAAVDQLRIMKVNIGEVFNAQGEYVKQLIDIGSVYLNGAKEFALNLRTDASAVAAGYKENGIVLASSIYDVILKQKETIGTLMESTGIRHSIDNILAEHEKIIYLLLQKASAALFLDDNEENFIGPDLSESKIREIVTRLVNNYPAQIVNNEQFMLHLRKLFETFYLNKLGKSLIQQSSVISTDSDRNNVYIPRTNEDFVENFRVRELKSKIQQLTTDKEEIIAFLSSLVNDVHNDQNYNHSKYFGSSVNAQQFVDNAIGNDSIAMAEYTYRLGKTNDYVEFYLTNIAGKNNSKGTSLQPGGRYSKAYDKIESDFLEEANSITDFANREYTTGYAAFEASGEENPNKAEMLKSMLDLIASQKTKVQGEIADKKAVLANKYQEIQQTIRQQESDRSRQRGIVGDKNPDHSVGHSGGRRKKTRTAKKSGKNYKKRKTMKKRKIHKKNKTARKRKGSSKKGKKSNRKRSRK